MNITIDNFLKELKLKGYPNKKYSEYYNFNKKILLDDYLKESNIINNKLYNKSLYYVSNLQKNLNDIQIENYIGGGCAISLYLNNLNNIPKNVIKTDDIDIILFFKKKELDNISIINNFIKIINLCIIKNSYKRILKLYNVIMYKNKREFDKIIKILLNNQYILYLYKPNLETNIYKLYFVKVIKNLYIKIIIKIIDNDLLINNNTYCYSKLSYYFINNNKIKDLLDIDFIFVKSKIKTKLICNTIKQYNNLFYVYNEKFIIYNLMHIYYNYTIKNKSTLIKIEEGKNKRDELRLYYMLYYMLNYYCSKYTCKDNIDIIFNRFKENVMLFNMSMFSIKNLDIINDIFLNKL